VSLEFRLRKKRRVLSAINAIIFVVTFTLLEGATLLGAMLGLLALNLILFVGYSTLFVLVLACLIVIAMSKKVVFMHDRRKITDDELDLLRFKVALSALLVLIMFSIVLLSLSLFRLPATASINPLLFFSCVLVVILVMASSIACVVKLIIHFKIRLCLLDIAIACSYFVLMTLSIVLLSIIVPPLFMVVPFIISVVSVFVFVY